MVKKIVSVLLIGIGALKLAACNSPISTQNTETTTSYIELSEKELENNFVDCLEDALIAGQDADLIKIISTNDEFITHYKLMMSTIKDGISEYSDIKFENFEFNKQYNLLKETINNACELFETTPFNTNTFLSSWFNYYWNFCNGIKYFYDNYNLKLNSTYEYILDYMIEIANCELMNLDDITTYQGGYTTYQYHDKNTNPDTVINDYEYIHLSYLDLENDDIVTDMHTFYIFGTDLNGEIVLVNKFMQPRNIIQIVKEGHIREIDRHNKDYIEDYYLINGYSKKIDESIVKVQPKIGMTETEILNSTWGSPKKVNTTTSKYSINEQWVYDRGYIYFDNGVVTDIQTK